MEENTPEPRKEDASVERPLSPVLSTGKKSNFLKLGGKLRKKASRVNLSKLYATNEVVQNNVTRETMLLYFSNVPDPNDSPEIRLRKLQGMEERRREYLRYLTDVHVEGEQIIVARTGCDDSKFKRPASPLVLKTKRDCGVIQTTNNVSVQTSFIDSNLKTAENTLQESKCSNVTSTNEKPALEEFHTPLSSISEDTTLTDSQFNSLVDDIELAVSRDENINNDRAPENQAYFKYVSQFLDKLETQKARQNKQTENLCQIQAVSDIHLHCQNILDLINLVEKKSASTLCETDIDCPGFTKSCIEQSRKRADICDNLVGLYEKRRNDTFKEITEEGIEMSIYCYKENIEQNHTQPKIKDEFYNDNFVTLYQNEKRKIKKSALPPRKRSKYGCFDKQKLTQEWFNTCFADGDFNKECETNTSATTNSESICKNVDKSVCHSPGFGFKCASGKEMKVSEAALLKAVKVFDEIIEEVKFSDNEEQKQCDFETIHFNSKFSDDSARDCATLTTATAVSNDCSKNLLDNVRTLQVQSAPIVGFTSASGKGIAVSKNALANAAKAFEEIDVELKSSAPPKSATTGFTSAAGKALSVSANAVGDAQKLFTDINQNQDDIVTCKSPMNERMKRKHLGVSHRMRKVPIEQRNLEKAKQMFEDISGDLTDIPKKITSCHTPKKQSFGGPYISIPVCNSSPIFFDKFSCDTKITANIVKNDNSSAATKTDIVIQSRTAGDVKDWINELEHEQNKLQEQLKIIYSKQQALQQQVIQLESEQLKNPNAGILFTKKKITGRRTLRQFVEGLKPGEQELDVGANVSDVNPKNACSVHFVCNSAVMETVDGAQIIPNKFNLIGISEIKSAFQVMPGVQKSLIPNNWIENHFKWIVWKLASMERSFPNHFSNCITVENVILQLKYRYDREIDRAERPALRRILEKDDAPQKRMVLCVSDIKKGNDDTVELELTDGWYSIRTLIDSPLNEQIKKEKLKIGWKIVIHGAELINCEGCHPLQTPQHVYLKINYNCTRRAVWDAKLGFQSLPGPLLISLKSINFKGGTVGHIKVYLARIYPLRYMEKQGNTVVWRNERAEEKRAKVFGIERLKRLEDIQYQVQRTFETEMKQKKRKVNVKEIDLPSILSGEILYDILTHSSDPESIMEKLTLSQQSVLDDYKRNHMKEIEEDLASRMRDAVNKSNTVNRDVIPILKMLIIDASDCSECSMILNIWKPADELIHTLKEGRVFSIYNAVPKNNGSLGSSCKTRFKEEIISISRFKKFSRQVLPIAVTMQPLYRPFLNEFDTVGIVAKTRISATNQDLWLSDLTGRLLLVKVSDSPDRCSIFDNLGRGHIVAVSNLVLCEPQNSFGFAMGNQYTTVTRYPKNRLLKEALDIFAQQTSKDTMELLNECEKKISIYVTKLGFINSLQNKSYSETLLAQTTSLNISDLLTDSSEDEGGLPAKLTTLDVAMSLIDMDSLAKHEMTK